MRRGEGRQQAHAFMADRTKEEWATRCLDIEEDLCRLLNSLEPLFESLEHVETNVLANWGTALPDSRIITIDAGTVRKIKAMAGKVRGVVE